MSVTLDPIVLGLEAGARLLALTEAGEEYLNWESNLIPQAAPTRAVLIHAGKDYGYDGDGARYEFTYHVPYIHRLHEVTVGLIVP